MHPIQVATETASGPSKITAFDIVLTKLGIQDYNLVEYSSVIPSGTEIQTKEMIHVDYPVGTTCGVVLSVDYSEPESEDPAYAELNWQQAEHGSGFFVEKTGERVTEEEMNVFRKNRNVSFKKPPEKVACISSNTDEYNCSLAIAFYGKLETDYSVDPYSY